MWVNCASAAFQHALLWYGKVNPSITLVNGDKKRAAAFVVADALTVCACLAMAVVLDLTGRAVGLSLAVSLASLGLLLFAVPPGIGTLSTGQVFYGVGFAGIRLVTEVLVANSTNMANRALGYASIATPWAAAPFAATAIRGKFGPNPQAVSAACIGVVLPLGSLLAAYLWHHRACDVRNAYRLHWDFEPKTYDEEVGLFDEILNGTFLVLGIVGIFVVLWLVQIDVVAWPYALAPVGLSAFFLLLFMMRGGKQPPMKLRKLLKPLKARESFAAGILCLVWKCKRFAKALMLTSQFPTPCGAPICIPISRWHSTFPKDDHGRLSLLVLLSTPCGCCQLDHWSAARGTTRSS